MKTGRATTFRISLKITALVQFPVISATTFAFAAFLMQRVEEEGKAVRRQESVSGNTLHEGKN